MIVRESVSLASLTTFKVGGPARYVIECAAEELGEAIAFAKEKGLPWRVLGQGSNVLAHDDGFAGVIIRLDSTSGLSVTDDGSSVLVVADAAMPWDALVEETTAKGLWGIENLAGIPGTVGAAPVQNIGAYGTELKATLEWVEAYDAAAGTVVRLDAAVCAFGYRDSRFKREPNLVILKVALRLAKDGVPKTSYADLARLVEDGAVLETPAQVAAAVRGVRAKKFPDLAKEGTAGSYFKNPIIPSDAFASLKTRYPDMPGFPGEGGVKVSLAWILDRVLSLRGFSNGCARLFEAQPLVIVADAGASEKEITALAMDVAERVKEATGIALEWEVRTLG